MLAASVGDFAFLVLVAFANLAIGFGVATLRGRGPLAVARRRLSVASPAHADGPAAVRESAR